MIKEMEAWDVVDECTRNNLTRRQSQSLINDSKQKAMDMEKESKFDKEFKKDMQGC